MQASWQNLALLNTTPVKVEAAGKAVHGTGFFVWWQEKEGAALFLVSNKHVLLSEESSVSVLVHQRSDKESGWFIGDGETRLWIDPHNHKEVKLPVKGRYFAHPDVDLACIECTEFNLRKDTILAPFSQDRILDWNKSELYPGQQVLFFGYPDKIKDQLHNLPVVRTATLASLPVLDYNGKPEFLIDGQVWKGSSGSPVFVATPDGNSAFSLIGIIHSQLYKGADQDTHLGLGLAVKSSSLVDLLGGAWRSLTNTDN